MAPHKNGIKQNSHGAQQQQQYYYYYYNSSKQYYQQCYNITINSTTILVVLLQQQYYYIVLLTIVVVLLLLILLLLLPEWAKTCALRVNLDGVSDTSWTLAKSWMLSWMTWVPCLVVWRDGVDGTCIGVLLLVAFRFEACFDF